MKRLILILSAMLGCIALSGQEANRVVVKGKISHHAIYPTDTSVMMVVMTPLEGIEHVLPLDEKGSFSLEVERPFPADFFFFYRDFTLLLPFRPGDSLFLEIDARPTDFSAWANQISVKGKGHEKAALAIQLEKDLWVDANRYQILRRSFKALEPIAFLAFADSIRAADAAIAQRVIDRHQPEPSVQTWLERVADRDYFYLMRWYPSWGPAETRDLPKRFNTFHLDFLPAAWVEDDWMSGDFWGNYANYFGYREVTGPIYAASRGTEVPFDRLDSLVIERWASLDVPDFLIQMCLARYVTGRLQMMDLNPIEAHGDFLRAQLGDSPFWPRVQAEVSQVERTLANIPSMQEPTFHTLEGVAGKDIIDSLVAHHPGQVIYLDVWATWCGPCRQQMPYSRQLHHSLKDVPVAFAYLCMQSDSAQYLPIIEQYQLSGSHYFLNASQGEAFAERCQLRGFPQYLIIDPEGEIVKNPAPSPSEEGVKQMLLDLVRR